MPRERAKERECELAIKKALSYSAVFKYPLSFHQLTTFLPTKKDFNYLFFTKQLRRLLKGKQIIVEKDKFSLPGIKNVSWQTRHKTTQELLVKYADVLNMLHMIPWAKMAAVTGSMGAYNAEKDSDMDLFIISSKNRVWLVRALTVLILKITKMYPHKDGEPQKICANLYIDETHLTWPKDKRSAYVAHDITLMQPVINRDHMYFKFIEQNGWVKDYLPNFKVTTEHKKPFNQLGGSLLLTLGNRLAMWLQTLYMKKRQTTETIKKHLIHFNKHDNSPRVLEEYKAVLEKVLGQDKA